MAAYYNDNDPKVCAWLRELISEGLIAQGDVDERGIEEVPPDDLEGYTQCHFFAGIGGWSYALRLAGWPDDEPVWTGSCPCQPLSSAGQRKGHADQRHLWPAFCHLIAECRPATVFGEQVASALGREWFAGVRADLEALGYACGGADLCAAGIGAPHIRQRLYWVADADESKRECADAREPDAKPDGRNDARGRSKDVRVGGAAGERLDGRQDSAGPRGRRGAQDDGWLGDADESGPQGRRVVSGEHADQLAPWAASLAIPCADGKYRRVPANEAGEPEPELFPLAYGLPARLVSLRGSGNSIVPQLAAEFILAAQEALSAWERQA